MLRWIKMRNEYGIAHQCAWVLWLDDRGDAVTKENRGSGNLTIEDVGESWYLFDNVHGWINEVADSKHEVFTCAEAAMMRGLVIAQGYLDEQERKR